MADKKIGLTGNGMNISDITTDDIRPKILIVDDRVENLVALERILAEMDAELIRALSGNEALALTLEHEFALALVDVQMPDMDGYETVELMHRESSPEALPVIFLSAVYSGDYHKLRGVEAGAVDFLEKPIIPEVLKGKVQVFLSLYRYRKLLENINDLLLKEVEERTLSLNETYDKLIRETREHLELQEQMQQVQKMEAIGTMAGGIAHDFNNILAIILMNASVLKDEMPPGEGVDAFRESLNDIIDAGIRGRDLTEKILTFSRMEKKQRDDIDAIDICAAVKESVGLVAHVLPATIHIEMHIDGDCGLVIARKSDIYQILLNLCINAKDAMDEHGALNISLTAEQPEKDRCIPTLEIRERGYMQLSVTDSGSGISEGEIGKIFNPFFTTKDVGKGTGMGLSVVHGLLKDLQGTVRVESESGRGTTFYVYIPLADEQLLVEEKKDSHVSLKGEERILFIDDEPALATLGERVLRKYGYQVEKYTDSTEALEKFRNSPDRFDLIVTDNYMPKMDGVKFSSEVLKIRQDIPIILSTGYSSKVTKKNYSDFGFCGILMKPFKPKELLQVVRGKLIV